MMRQECPRCEKKFNLSSIRDYDDGTMRLSDYPTQGHAIFCPYCGVRLDSWAAWIGKEVLIFYNDEQLDGIEVILKDVDEDYNLFEVLDQQTGRLYQVSSEVVYTPN